jgi:MFS family permease
MGVGGSLYKLVLLLHLSAVVIGFGSNFVYPVLNVRARKLAPKERFAVAHAAYQIERSLTTGPMILAGILGLILVLVSDELWTFSQLWVSVAFLLYFVGTGVSIFLVAPNAKAMDELGARLAQGQITASKSGGAPKEAVELEARAGKAAAFGGIIHLVWFLLMVDMIWKPGLG